MGVSMPETGFYPLQRTHAQITSPTDTSPDVATTSGDWIWSLPAAGLSRAALDGAGDVPRFPLETGTTTVRLRPYSTVHAESFGEVKLKIVLPTGFECISAEGLEGYETLTGLSSWVGNQNKCTYDFQPNQALWAGGSIFISVTRLNSFTHRLLQKTSATHSDQRQKRTG